MTQNDGERRWLVLAVIGVAQLMVVLDATIVNIALPSAQRDLDFGTDSRQWIITAYALAFGSLLLLGGKLSDLFGRRWTFVAGLIGFAGASALGGAAQSFDVLVGARALQGVFGALLAPAALSTLAITFTDAKERGRAFGVYSAIAGSGAAVGLLLGGILTDWLSWRWCLYVNLAFAVPAAAAALVLIPRGRAGRRPRIDLLGTLLASLGLFGIVFGFSHAETDSWSDPTTVASLVGGLALLAAFVAAEARISTPLLPLRVLRDRNRGAAYIALLLSGAAMFGAFLFLTYYLQRTLGFSPIEAGLAFLPLALAVILAAGLSNTRLLPRFGPRPLVPCGMLLGAAGMTVLTQLEADSSYGVHVLPGIVLLGLGLGFAFAPSINTATSRLERADAGVGSAMVNTCQQIGGSVGTAALSTVFSAAVTDYATSSPGPGVMQGAAMHGYSTAFWWSVGLFVVGALLTGALFRSGAPVEAQAGAPAPSAA